MKSTSPILRWSLTFIVCGAIAAGVYYFEQGKQASAVGQQPPEMPEMIEAATVRSTLWSPKTKILGEVISPSVVTLRNELEGTITQINFPSGGQVKKGQMLLQLDVTEEKAQLANVKANLELAEIELKRNKKLYKQKIVSQDNFDRARIQVKIKQAELEAINSLINKKTIRAPFDALTGLHSLEVGQYLSANSQINTLVGIESHIWVDFKLPQQHANIDTSSKVLIETPFSSQSVEGKIIAKDTVINKAARSLTFRAEIPNQDYLFKPGSVVSVLASTAAPSKALKIPTSSILRDQFSSYVYLLSPAKDNKNYRANRQDITLGDAHGKDTVVTSGLKMNDLVVQIGAFKLRPNMLVTFNQTSGPDATLDTSTPVLAKDSE